jgi:hypothetical protein
MYRSANSLNALLIGLSRALVLLLIDFVGSSVKSARSTARERSVAGVALGLLLVGLLGSFGGVALDSFGDVVGGVLDRVGGLADDALVRLVDVGSGHFLFCLL